MKHDFMLYVPFHSVCIYYSKNCALEKKPEDTDITEQRHKSKCYIHAMSKGRQAQRQKRGDKYKHRNRQPGKQHLKLKPGQYELSRKQ